MPGHLVVLSDRVKANPIAKAGKTA